MNACLMDLKINFSSLILIVLLNFFQNIGKLKNYFKNFELDYELVKIYSDFILICYKNFMIYFKGLSFKNNYEWINLSNHIFLIKI